MLHKNDAYGRKSSKSEKPVHAEKRANKIMKSSESLESVEQNKESRSGNAVSSPEQLELDDIEEKSGDESFSIDEEKSPDLSTDETLNTTRSLMSNKDRDAKT